MRILCYGDSNTWGSEPTTRDRLPRHQRWPGVLAETLGGQVEVVEEGLRGRTTVFDDPYAPGRNGREHLMVNVLSHQPLDMIILMLGTNDAKSHLGASPEMIAEGMASLVELIRSTPLTSPADKMPEVLVVSPPATGQIASRLKPDFDGAGDKVGRLPDLFAKVATDLKCDFFDASQHVSAGDFDGIHLRADEHRKLGVAIAHHLMSAFGSNFIAIPNAAFAEFDKSRS